MIDLNIFNSTTYEKIFNSEYNNLSECLLIIESIIDNLNYEIVVRISYKRNTEHSFFLFFIKMNTTNPECEYYLNNEWIKINASYSQFNDHDYKYNITAEDYNHILKIIDIIKEKNKFIKLMSMV